MSRTVPPLNAPLPMQSVLRRLQEYWADEGCTTIQPTNTEVGAGTANPATALRVLGPEPWRAAYVEPSVRPDDSRYGENPNRLQTHTQFQVILKPDPGNPQELYLSSLEAIGIDIGANDIRFVEDNWASPALGAWGLGWEVWLNGLEITQFTYFQQAGGLSLDPVSVEITYGIERIVMALQGVSHFRDIEYAPGVSYGEMFGQAEYEMSRYYLDDADVERNRSLFDLYAAEAARLVERRLPVPAYGYVLKCSHTFNILDARGAISTTERAHAFGRMRGLTREVARLWAERRAELGHPLGIAAPAPAAVAPRPAPAAQEPETLVFEIGLEELPHHEVARGAKRLEAAAAAKLAATRLDHGSVRVVATPRRIALIVNSLAPRERPAERFIRGPRKSAAFDMSGAPTNAAIGFAKKNGVAVEDLLHVEDQDGEFVGIRVLDGGREAADVIGEIVRDLVVELRSDRNMRWRDEGISYSRPVRWLLVLLGDRIVPVAVGSLISGRSTRVLRTADHPEVEIRTAGEYESTLEASGIVLDGSARRALILEDATRLAAAEGGIIDIDGEAELIDEIANLVEAPTTLSGGFEERYLELPSAVLTTVMKKHQRFLPVRDPEGALLPCFVAVANGTCDEAVVRTGYEAVLRARYEDAAFFWRADLCVTPQAMMAKLSRLTFEDKLGSMAERSARIRLIADDLAASAGIPASSVAIVRRAGQLAKFDLSSQMVVEMSSLAGTMAREYATRAGEDESVARALEEMEMPRKSGAALPSTTAGSVLAVADRADLLTGLYSVGTRSTGSSDPYGLRRAGNGLIAILRTTPELGRLTLRGCVDSAIAALQGQGIEVPQGTAGDVYESLLRRYEQQHLDEGADAEAVRSVLVSADRPAIADELLVELRRRRGTGPFEAMAEAFRRVARIIGPDVEPSPDDVVLSESADRTLGKAVELADALPLNIGEAQAYLDGLAELTHPINDFFGSVMVMAEDLDIRRARLALLARLHAVATRHVDWAALPS